MQTGITGKVGTLWGGRRRRDLPVRRRPAADPVSENGALIMTASVGMPGTSETPAETPDKYHDHDAALKWALRLENAAWLPLILAIFALIILVAELYVYMPQIVSAGAFEAY